MSSVPTSRSASAPAPATNPVPTNPPATGTAATLVQGATRCAVCLLVADTPAKREIGLMGRTTIAPFDAMLFVFEAEARHAFWMYQTPLPLELVPVAADGRLGAPIAMAPCPPSAGRNCPVYRPEAPYDRALELEPGHLAALGLRPGAEAIRLEVGSAPCSGSAAPPA